MLLEFLQYIVNVTVIITVIVNVTVIIPDDIIYWDYSAQTLY